MLRPRTRIGGCCWTCSSSFAVERIEVFNRLTNDVDTRNLLNGARVHVCSGAADPAGGNLCGTADNPGVQCGAPIDTTV